jgi:hypothetical protein
MACLFFLRRHTPIATRWGRVAPVGKIARNFRAMIQEGNQKGVNLPGFNYLSWKWLKKDKGATILTFSFFVTICGFWNDS